MVEIGTSDKLLLYLNVNIVVNVYTSTFNQEVLKFCIIELESSVDYYLFNLYTVKFDEGVINPTYIGFFV